MHSDSAEDFDVRSKPSFDDDVRTAGPYRYVRFLAQGGMGRVDLALRNVDRFARLYAVKRLHPHLARDPSAREMFLEEARIGGLLSHPNLVGVIDFGDDAHGPYLVMDFVDGVSLAALRALANKRGEQLPIEVCVAIVLSIARGLDAIHAVVDRSGAPLELLHRDLTPKNVLIGYDGSVRVTDFGIAKGATSAIRTTTGVLKGTVGYLAPERLKFDEPTPRADLFSLGVIAYELLTGERLFPGDAVDAARATLTAPPPDLGELRPDAPSALTELLFRLLAKDPNDRPESAAETASVLETVLAQSSESSTLAPWVSMLAAERRATERAEIDAAIRRLEVEARSARRWSMRRRAIAIGALGLVVVVGAIAVAITTSLDDPARETSAERSLAAPIARETKVEAVEAPPAEATEPPSEAADPRPSPRRAKIRRVDRGAAPGEMTTETTTEMASASGTPLEMTWTGEFR